MAEGGCVGPADGAVTATHNGHIQMIDNTSVRSHQQAATAKKEAPLQQAALRERNLVERFFSKLKRFRRVATHYDKAAGNFLTMIRLASMRLGCALMWLRNLSRLHKERAQAA
jgi:transposase